MPMASGNQPGVKDVPKPVSEETTDSALFVRTSADHGTLNYCELQLVAKIRHQCRQIGDQRIVVDGRQRRGSQEQWTLGKPAQ